MRDRKERGETQIAKGVSMGRALPHLNADRPRDNIMLRIMPTKTKAGLAGAIAVVVILGLQAVEHWSVVDSVLTGLRNMGAGGAFVTKILLSPLLALALAIAAIYLVYAGQKETEKRESAPLPTIDNSANQAQIAGNTGNVTQQVFVSRDIESGTVEREEEEEQEIATISYIQSKETLLRENEYAIWQEAASNLSSASPALIAEFKNKPKEVGKRTAKASSITASLVLKGKGNPEELHISYGTWLNEFTYFASFASGVSHHLIIAVKLGNPFVTLNNPRTKNPFRHFTSGMVIHHAQPIALPAPQGEVEITLVDTGGYTVFSGRFDYEVSLNGMSLKPRPTR
jgi:hypothetical protein